MATAAQLRTGIETQLRLMPKTTVYRRWPNNINFPSGGGVVAIVSRGAMNPEQTFGSGALARWAFQVHLLASLAPGYEQAQDTLDPYIQTTSTGGVYQAIAGDRTLGGIANVTTIMLGPDEQIEVTPDVYALGAVVDLELWAS